MNNIKIIAIIIAVNVVKVERVAAKRRIKTVFESEEKPANKGFYHIPPTTTVHQLNVKGPVSAETSVGPSGDYGFVEYEETNKESTRRFEDSQDDYQSSEEHVHASPKQKTIAFDKVGTLAANENIDKDELNIDPNKQKIMSHVMLDTKGRSAAEDANEKVFKIFQANVRNVDVPRLNNPSRSAFITPYFTTIQRPGLFPGSLHTVHHPVLFHASPELTLSTEKLPHIEEKEKLPFIAANSYPYQNALINIDETRQDDYKVDIFKKLMEATNTAMTSDNPVPHFGPNNMYPGTLYPRTGTYRRFMGMNLDSLRTVWPEI